jgi:hypothetical protein
VSGRVAGIRKFAKGPQPHLASSLSHVVRRDNPAFARFEFHNFYSNKIRQG